MLLRYYWNSYISWFGEGYESNNSRVNRQYQNKERQYHFIDLYSGMQRKVISTIVKDTLKKWMVEHIDSLRNKLYV